MKVRARAAEVLSVSVRKCEVRPAEMPEKRRVFAEFREARRQWPSGAMQRIGLNGESPHKPLRRQKVGAKVQQQTATEPRRAQVTHDLRMFPRRNDSKRLHFDQHFAEADEIGAE